MRNILWIDDKPEFCGIIHAISYYQKKHAELQFIIAKDDAAGTKDLKEKKFDLIILDIHMKPAGGKSIVEPNTEEKKVGLRLFQCLREGKIGGETLSYTPVIVVTALPLLSDNLLTNLLSIDPAPACCFQKPYNLFQLEKTIMETLKEKL